jgi:hypothetical protein
MKVNDSVRQSVNAVDVYLMIGSAVAVLVNSKITTESEGER